MTRTPIGERQGRLGGGNAKTNRAPRIGTPCRSITRNAVCWCRSALRELEAATGLRTAILLTLDDAGVTGQEAGCLQRRTQARLVVGQGLGDAVTDRTGLTGQTAAGDRRHHIVLVDAGGDLERLVQQHAQDRTGEIDADVAAVDGDLAGTGLDPDAGDRVLALAGGIGAARGVDLRLRGGLLGNDGGGGRKKTAGQVLKIGESGGNLRHDLRDPLVLRVHGADVQNFRLLGLMRMGGAAVNLQVGHLLAAERTTRNHTLDGLHDHALRILAIQDLTLGTALDAAGIARVPVEDVVIALVARQANLLGIYHDDVVAAVDMRGIEGLVLAAQDIGDDARHAAEDEAFRVDYKPLLIDFGRLQGQGLHCHSLKKYRMRHESGTPLPKLAGVVEACTPWSQPEKRL